MPSPHHFVFKQRRDNSPTKPETSPSQFAKTPRFSSGRPKAQSSTSSRKSPVRLNFSQRPPAEHVEDNEEMLLGEHETAHPTTEGHDITQARRSYDLPHSPKRQRLSADFSSPLRSGLAAPSAVVTPTHVAPTSDTASRRFGISSTAQEHGTPGISNINRPSFLRSSVAPQQEAAEPLPEAFSPHRRGAKFLPGGMAAEAQHWVLEAGQAATQSRRGQGYLRGEDYVQRVKVDECAGDGPVLVRGRIPGGERTNVLLADGVSKSVGEERGVEVGDVIGVRAPILDVHVAGETWAVGVDWKILTS